MELQKNKRILVTGGSGFIGTNLVDFYLKQEQKVLNLDSHPPRNTDHTECYQFVDLLDGKLLSKLVTTFSPTHIIHLAARTDLDETDDISGYNANTDGVKNLIDATLKCSDLERVIFCSSMLVCQFGYTPKTKMDYRPNTLYGESKVRTEELVFGETLPYVWSIVRPTSIWGPWFGIPYKLFFDCVCNGRFVHPGKKAGTATYGYIGNTVYQIDCILKAEPNLVDNGIFYLGDDPPNNLSEWADEIASFIGKSNRRVPYWSVKLGALAGDILKSIGICFPITSFRLKNMSTNNIVELSDIYKVAPDPPFSRQAGISETLKWMGKLD